MSLYYNGDTSYLFVDRKKNISLKLMIKMLTFQLDLEEVSFKRNVFNFSVDCDAIGKSEISNIKYFKYLMVKKNIK